MINDHEIQCDCYECRRSEFEQGWSDNFSSSKYIGYYIRSSEKTYKYHKPGDKPFGVVEPSNIIGSVLSFNKDKTWALVQWMNNTYWVSFVRPEIYKIGNKRKKLTEEEKIAARKIGSDIALKGINPTAYAGKKVLETGQDVAEGVADAAESGLGVISFIGKNLKLIMIAIAIIVIIGVVSKVKNIVT